LKIYRAELSAVRAGCLLIGLGRLVVSPHRVFSLLGLQKLRVSNGDSIESPISTFARSRSSPGRREASLAAPLTKGWGAGDDAITQIGVALGGGARGCVIGLCGRLPKR
jgi:hypothetical protein